MDSKTLNALVFAGLVSTVATADHSLIKNLVSNYKEEPIWEEESQFCEIEYSDSEDYKKPTNTKPHVVKPHHLYYDFRCYYRCYFPYYPSHYSFRYRFLCCHFHYRFHCCFPFNRKSRYQYEVFLAQRAWKFQSAEVLLFQM